MEIVSSSVKVERCDLQFTLESVSQVEELALRKRSRANRKNHSREHYSSAIFNSVRSREKRNVGVRFEFVNCRCNSNVKLAAEA